VALAIGALILLVVAIRLLPAGLWIQQFQTSIRGYGALGYLLYALVYAACCVLFIPASILTLGAGAIFGIVPGALVVIAGATLGAILSFLLARTILRGRVEAMTAGNARFRALDRAIARAGAKIVFLIRLSPIFPFTYVNYAFGLTAVRLLPYSIATLAGIVPGTLAYVYIGYAAASAATGGGSTTRAVVQIAGAAAALVATIAVARIATKAIRQTGVDDLPDS
jgi:uncharacterized membrane protein YdjX (TVP38/TMEM64 family)